MSDMRIYQSIRDIRAEHVPNNVSKELIGLLSGDHCITAEDRCVALISLCESLHDRITWLERHISEGGAHA